MTAAPPLCDRCGEFCDEGFEERVLATDPETGYQDTETVCSFCTAEESKIFVDVLDDDSSDWDGE